MKHAKLTFVTLQISSGVLNLAKAFPPGILVSTMFGTK